MSLYCSRNAKIQIANGADMQSYLKTKPVFVQILMFLGMAFGIFMVMFTIGIPVLSKMTGLSAFQLADMDNWDSSNSNTIIFLRGMLLLQFLGLFVIPSLLFAYFSDPQPLQYIGLNGNGKASYWILGIAALLLATPLVEYIGIINKQLVFGEGAKRWVQTMEEEALKQIQFMLQKHTPTELIYNLIFIALFAGIGEELFFRGVLQRLLIKSFKNPWMGIVVAATVFSAFHFQFFGFLPRLLLGVLLGAIYWYSGSLWPSILAHFVYDGFIIVMMYANPSLADNADASLFDGQRLALYALGSAVLVTAIIWQMHKTSTITYEEVYKNDEPDFDAPDLNSNQ